MPQTHPPGAPAVSTARLDMVAGLTASAVVLPKAMAFATIAGLPVSVGLYTAFTALVEVPAWLDFEFLHLSGIQWLLLGLVPLLAWSLAFVALLPLRRILHQRMGLSADKLNFLGPLRWTLGSLLCWLCWSAISLPQGLLLPLAACLKFLGTYATVASGFALCDVAAQSLSVVTARTPTTRDDMMVPLLRRAAKVLIVVMGLLVIAQNLDIEVWSLFAGFSIVGAMVALAGQETVKNFFGSFTILVDQPFAVGDWINLEGAPKGSWRRLAFAARASEPSMIP